MRFIFLSFLAIFSISNSFGAADSLIIKGRINNLNGRLYRQAPFITFSRNNIFQPQSELSKQAPLEADGSFRISLPMLFPQEEIYLDYGGKAFTTFLGSPGTVEISFDGDSLGKASRLFFFAGANADANNQFPLYLAAENKLTATSKPVSDNSVYTAKGMLGPDFFKTFWENSQSGAKAMVGQRAALRLSTLSDMAKTTTVSPALRKWIFSIANDESLQLLYEHALSRRYEVPSDLLDSLNRLPMAPLTSQRVIWASRFGEYADYKVQETKYANPTKTNSLPVKLMASLIRTYTSALTADERTYLDKIAGEGIQERGELDMLNKLFARNEMTLNILFNYERESRIYNDLFDDTATEFLNTRYLAQNLYKYNYRQLMLLNRHIQSGNRISAFRQSLDELVSLEVKDSSDVKKVVDFRNLKTDPTEVLPGYYFAASNDRGTSWFNHVLDKYKGKTVYIVKWNLNDNKSREELEFIPALEARSPADVVFIFIHLPNDEFAISDDLIKQYIVRHKLKGVHLSMDNNQGMDLLFRLNPLDYATFALVRPNGKFASKNASPPSATEKTIAQILGAAR